MTQQEQKIEVGLQPCLQFQENERFIILCEVCGEIIGKTVLKAGDFCETPSIFLRFKKEKTFLLRNNNICGRRLMDLFATYCSSCEFNSFHKLSKEENEEMAKPKFGTPL
jgi:ribosomal protein L37E